MKIVHLDPEPLCGDRLNETCERATKQCADSAEPLCVRFSFNDIELVARPGVTAGDLCSEYRVRCEVRRAEAARQRAEWERSPEGQAELARQKREREAFLARRAEAFSVAPEEPSWSDPEGWKKCVDANTDDYGKAGVDAARDWARLMEGQLAAGASLPECAWECFLFADEAYRTTGMQFSFAKAMLKQVWKHGAELAAVDGL